MSNFIAVVQFAGSTVEIKFDTISEYSDAYDAVSNGQVLQVEFFLDKNYTNLEDEEFDFFMNFEDITYQLIEDFESGDYDDIVNDGNNGRVAFEYLVENVSMDAYDALEKYMDVRVFEGTVEEYADEYVSDVYDIPNSMIQYFNINQFATDLESDGSIVDLDGYVITNGNEF